MATRSLEDLKWVNPRCAWDHEALDFTPWLANNLNRLTDVIGIELELESTEVEVNGLRADIVARDPRDGNRVLIENQLERADLHHLGQVLAYLAGLDAKVVIWVATNFDAAHLSALRWLNEHSGEGFAFFATRIRAARIGDSAMAPVFEVLERPNEWEIQIRSVARRSGLSTLGQFRQNFWVHFERRHPGTVRSGFAGSNVYDRVEDSGRRVCIYMAQNGARIYYPLERGESTAERSTALAAPVAMLKEEISAEGAVGEVSGSGHFFLSIDATDQTNWDQMSDWMAKRREQWTRAVQQTLVQAD